MKARAKDGFANLRVARGAHHQIHIEAANDDDGYFQFFRLPFKYAAISRAVMSDFGSTSFVNGVIRLMIVFPG